MSDEGARPRVLVVDDRRENRIAMEALLEDLEVEVVCAASGNEALGALLEDDFAVVLMDVQMPEMDGFETVSLMRANRRTRHTPVVFVTAISKEERFVAQGYDVGAVDYLFKPVDPHILRGKVVVFVELYELSRLLAQKNAELEAMAAQLKEASVTDPLTGLHNRRYLEEAIDTELALARRMHADVRRGSLREGVNTDVGFMMVDVDHFKRLNDRYGHAVGDRVLVEVAARVQSAVRESDTVLRWGGEEFLVVLRRTEAARVARVAERVRDAVYRDAFDVGGGESVRVSCSVGFSGYPVAGGDSYSWEDVVQAADRALYVAKEEGRNTWVGIHILAAAADDDEKRRRINELEGAEREGVLVMTRRGAEEGSR